MTIFLTADQHFSHKNIIQYSSHPFSSIEYHDEALITAWNETVSDRDTVYHLGDFTLGNSKKANHILKLARTIADLAEANVSGRPTWPFGDQRVR